MCASVPGPVYVKFLQFGGVRWYKLQKRLKNAEHVWHAFLICSAYIEWHIISTLNIRKIDVQFAIHTSPANSTLKILSV